MESGAGARCYLAPILFHVAFQVDPLAQPGTVTLYLGANRGRGQTNHVVVSRRVPLFDSQEQ